MRRDLVSQRRGRFLLAAHGLAGRGVEATGSQETGPAPVRLSFETGEAVDDIQCELSDGTVLRVQAKL